MEINKIIHIPNELNAEILFMLLQKEDVEYSVECDGVFYRNYSEDILNMDGKKKVIHISRDSLYHMLPQALFHQIDLFKGITGKDHAEKFNAKWEELNKKERIMAAAFFKPFDNILFSLRTGFRQWQNELLSSCGLFLRFILDNKDALEDTDNPYLQHVAAFLPWVENIRGNKQKQTIILRQILGENINLEIHTFIKHYKNTDMELYSCLLDSFSCENWFCDNEYDDCCFLFSVTIQQRINDLIETQTQEKQLEEFRIFFHNYFLPIMEEFEIHLGDFEKEPKLSEESPLFLGYNTQII